MRNIRFILSGLAHAHSSFTPRIGHGAPLRTSSSSLRNGIFQNLSAYKLTAGARFFASTEIPPHIVLEMPALSPTMNQGNITKWWKKEGDKINVGDVICEIETDKATLEFESLEEGYLAKILAPEGSKDVFVGQPIAITVENQDDIQNVPTTVSGRVEVKEENSTQNVGDKESPEKTNVSRISPSAKLLIAEYGLDASSLKASGPRGTLLKGDVLTAIKSGGGSKKAREPSQEKTSALPQSVSPTAHPLSQAASPLCTMDTYEDLQNSQIRKAGPTQLYTHLRQPRFRVYDSYIQVLTIQNL